MSILTLLISLSVPFFASLQNATAKGSLKDKETGIDPYSLLFVMQSMGLVLTLVFLVLAPEVWSWATVQMPSEIGSEFWWALLAKTPLQLTALMCMLYAFRHNLSGAAPVLLLTPVLAPISGYFLIGSSEMPSALGWIGMAVVITGAYLLNWKEIQKGFFAPVIALVKNPASFFMLITAVLWSVTTTLDKVGTVSTTPLTWVFYTFASLIILMTVLAVVAPRFVEKYGEFRPRRSIGNVRTYGLWVPLLTVGAFGFTAETAQMFALTLMAAAAYVIALKRASVLLDLFIGTVFFGEREWRRALPGALAMLCGIYIILFVA